LGPDDQLQVLVVALPRRLGRVVERHDKHAVTDRLHPVAHARLPFVSRHYPASWRGAPCRIQYAACERRVRVGAGRGSASGLESRLEPAEAGTPPQTPPAPSTDPKITPAARTEPRGA